MRRYDDKIGTPTRVHFGIQLVAGLRAFPETAALAPPFENINEKLHAANVAREAKRKPVAEASAACRFANYEADKTVRMLARDAQIADGGRRGPASNELFPEGVAGTVKPEGAKQVAQMKRLATRLLSATDPRGQALASEWLPRIEAARQSLEQALAAQSAAQVEYDAAFRAEVALRRQHAIEVDRIAGAVRSTFPRDREKQDVVFPAKEKATSASPIEPAPAPGGLAPA